VSVSQRSAVAASAASAAAAETKTGTEAAADAAVVSGLAQAGWAVYPGFVAADQVLSLLALAHAADAAGELRPAAIGAGDARRMRADIRGDRICWIEPPGAYPSESALLARLDRLRSNVNRELQLGLFDLECHYALYPAGARYTRHRDRFAGDDRRALSCVLYLNSAWCSADGGQLRLHLDGGRCVDVPPEGGTLAAFLSERIEHEVLPATRDRASIAGWFRRRAARG